VLGKYVRQSGSLVEPDRLRFDFTHFRRLDDEQIERIEDLVNEKVREDHRVRITEKTLREALDEGVTAIFEEKYGDIVRVVDIGGFSKELCGGTHLKHTSQVCIFKIVAERSVQSGVRRIEALTGERAYARIRSELKELDAAYEELRCQPGTILSEIKKLKNKSYEEKEWRRFGETVTRVLEDAERRKRELEERIEGHLREAKEADGLYPMTVRIDGWSAEDLQNKIDEIKSKDERGNAPVCLVTVKDGKAVAVIGGKGEALEKGFDSSEAARIVGGVLGGSGGGRKDFARAGGPNADRIDDALKTFEEYVRGL